MTQYTTTIRPSRGDATITDNRRSFRIDVTPTRYLTVEVNIQKVGERVALVDVAYQEMIDGAAYGSRSDVKGHKGNASWFPERTGKYDLPGNASVVAWSMSGMNSSMVQFNSAETFTTCELLGLALALSENDLPHHLLVVD